MSERRVPRQGGPSEPLASLDRTNLPIPEPPPATSDVIDARDAGRPPEIFEVEAPAGAPNVLIVLIDDMGFGMSSTFGGPIAMPTFDRLAAGGLRYNCFHTTALCSPTRTTLLTGRNHHMNNMGVVTELATGFPGYTGVRPQGIATLAEILRLNGYNTAAFGKYHETPTWETSPVGPFDRWPNNSGFERFYGFIGGETNQWAPLVHDDMTVTAPAGNPDYHFMVDMTDKAIAWLRAGTSLDPDDPFFIYFAPGACHAPHHVPKEWIEKYRGKFDAGWDAMRAETHARQLAAGIIPAGTELAPKPEAIKDWDQLSADEQRLFARQMEVYSGFAEHCDSEIGRLVDEIAKLGRLDNTLVFYIAGDNGASAEGGMAGIFNEMSFFNGFEEPLSLQLDRIDELGGPSCYSHFAAGWAVAGDAPFTWTKQVASSYGGTRNGLVVHWPAGNVPKGELRSQWHHVVDVAPTVLEAAQLPEPKAVHGFAQIPMQGASMVYSFRNAGAPDQHQTQYFEIMANRSIYHDGWFAGTIHRAPWENEPRCAIADDVWELYNTREDFSLAHDLAAEEPDKLAEMQALFLEVAKANHALPIDDRSLERTFAPLVGRPQVLESGTTSLTLYPGMQGLLEDAFIDVKNRGFSVTAEVEIPQGGAEGVIIAQGGRFGGWALWLDTGRPRFTYNFLGFEHTDVAASEPLAAGAATVGFELVYDGGGPGAGGTIRLSAGDRELATGRLERTQSGFFSGDEGADVGLDLCTPVSDDYESPNRFTGTIERIVVEVKPYFLGDQPRIEELIKRAKNRVAEFA